MNIKYVFFENGKSYYPPNGEEWTSNYITSRWPRVLQEPHYFETVGTTVLTEPYPLSHMLAMHDLDENLTGNDALTAIAEKVKYNTELDQKLQAERIDPNERIAAALEAQNMINGYAVSEPIIASNFARGLWSSDFLQKAVIDGKLTTQTIERVNVVLEETNAGLKISK